MRPPRSDPDPKPDPEPDSDSGLGPDPNSGPGSDANPDPDPDPDVGPSLDSLDEIEGRLLADGTPESAIKGQLQQVCE